MLAILSPAKTLDFNTPWRADLECSSPHYLNQADTLAKLLRTYSQKELRDLLGVSDKLALLNYERYQTWSIGHTLENSKPALWAYQGDVYEGLKAREFTKNQWQQAEKTIRVISGLYGIVRPLDLIQPYRLEMSTRLASAKSSKTPSFSDLYEFWGSSLASNLQEELRTHKEKILVNLASNEYSKALGLKQFPVPVIDIAFKDWKNGDYKIISFFAKFARGAMARFMVEHKPKHVTELKEFKAEGYSFSKAESSDSRYVFLRKTTG